MDRGVASPAQDEREQHLVLVLLRDRPGAMERVMGLLRRRTTASVAAVSFAPSEDHDVLRVTIALHGARSGIEHVVSHLRKLEDVCSAQASPASKMERDAVVRELALIRVACDATSRREIVDLAHLFGARAVDVTDSSITLEASGDGDTIENLLRLLRPIGIRELARTGKVLLQRDGERPDTTNDPRDEMRATG